MDVLIENLFPGQTLEIPGYFAKSTAPANVEDDSVVRDVFPPTIKDVVEQLYQNSQLSTDELGLVITIHGYNTGAGQDNIDGVRQWYESLCTYINEDKCIQNRKNSSVFLGYRWPSEHVPGSFKDAFAALPLALYGLLSGGISLAISGLVLAGLLTFWASQWTWLSLIPTIVGVFFFTLFFTLFILRIVLYFRDSYRAINYGVPDLMELIRQLDQSLIDRRIEDLLNQEDFITPIKTNCALNQIEFNEAVLAETIAQIRQALDRKEVEINPENPKFVLLLSTIRQACSVSLGDEVLVQIAQEVAQIGQQQYDKAVSYWRHKPVKLSFIGHSMGGLVTTQVIRILSDVFDQQSIGALNSTEKSPSSRVGRVFSLGRLVLASPDIPVRAIVSGRANFLRSSLRRFEEAYLFSNEGDLALRMASTAANYFSFPAKTRTQGYRLGNVTVNPKESQSSYGVVNLSRLPQIPVEHLLGYLEVSVLQKNNNQSLDPQAEVKGEQESLEKDQKDPESIADLFTYFDCTEYRDRTDYGKFKDSNDLVHQTDVFNVMICDRQRSPLKLPDYLKLLFAYAQFSPDTFPKGRDVHGGYFWGRLSKRLIYRLAFVGFKGLLDSLVLETPEELGITNPLPNPLKDRLARIPALNQAIEKLKTSNSNDSELSDLLIEKRRIAIRYFSWVCEQKCIQVAASPERYMVDVLGRDRDAVRLGILAQEPLLDTLGKDAGTSTLKSITQTPKTDSSKPN
ncbi:MAG: alpha/beta hydrolase [Scytolyngbya sp. HA4215-MV1]|jgi:hypothetical protein|nr:alpha/beta hydrolase [Scytolyngbya sp. HA4215-MV1]